MADAGKLFVQLMLDSTRYAAGMSQVTKNTNRTVLAMQKQLRGLVNFAIGAGGLYAIVRGFQAVTAAAAEQEEAALRLSQTLKNNYQFTTLNLRALEDQASALQKVTRYGDDQITNAQSLLMALGKLNAEGVRKLTPSLLDFATAMGMDLTAAAQLLGKTLGSSTNALTRYGVQIDMSKQGTERLDEMVKQLNATFGGQSQIKGYTTSAAQLKNAMGELSEEIGFLALGKQGGVLGAMASGFGAVADNMKRAREEAELMKLAVEEAKRMELAGPKKGTPANYIIGVPMAGTREYTPQQIAEAELARTRAEYKKIRDDMEVARRRMQQSGEMDPARQQRLAYNLAAEEEYKKRIEDSAAAETKRLKDSEAAEAARVKARLDAIREMQDATEKFWVEDDVMEWNALEDSRQAAQERADIMRPLLEKYHVEEDLADWYKLQDEQKKDALFKKQELQAASDDFADYAWTIKSTWATAIEDMIYANKRFALTFQNLVARPLWSVLSGRLANIAVDYLTKDISEWKGWSFGSSRTPDYGGGGSYEGANKPAFGGVTVNLTPIEESRVVAIVENNMRNNGTLRR